MPRATRFYLLRHGRVDPAWRQRIYGDLDVPLAPEGREDARRAAEALAGEALDAVLSSGLARAEEGAALLRRGRALERRDAPALREIHRGAWAGRSYAELERESPGAWERWCAHPDRLRPPSGETLVDLARRVLPQLDALAVEFEGGAIALVLHRWVIRTAVCAALSLPLAAASQVAVEAGSLAAIDWGPGSARVLAGLGFDAPPPRAAGPRWGGR
jgi:broad specificity phosphatase PhoE